MKREYTEDEAFLSNRGDKLEYHRRPTGRPHPRPTGKPHPRPTGKPHPRPTGKPHPRPTGKPHPRPKPPHHHGKGPHHHGKHPPPGHHGGHHHRGHHGPPEEPAIDFNAVPPRSTMQEMKDILRARDPLNNSRLRQYSPHRHDVHQSHSSGLSRSDSESKSIEYEFFDSHNGLPAEGGELGTQHGGQPAPWRHGRLAVPIAAACGGVLILAVLILFLVVVVLRKRNARTLYKRTPAVEDVPESKGQFIYKRQINSIEDLEKTAKA